MARKAWLQARQLEKCRMFKDGWGTHGGHKNTPTKSAQDAFAQITNGWSEKRKAKLYNRLFK